VPSDAGAFIPKQFDPIPNGDDGLSGKDWNLLLEKKWSGVSGTHGFRED
jgi:hypothetical protein